MIFCIEKTLPCGLKIEARRYHEAGNIAVTVFGDAEMMWASVYNTSKGLDLIIQKRALPILRQLIDELLEDSVSSPDPPKPTGQSRWRRLRRFAGLS